MTKTLAGRRLAGRIPGDFDNTAIPGQPANTVPAADAKPWYQITAQADDDAAVIDIYGPISSWSGVRADQFVADLREVTAKRIELHLNTPGGSVFDGVAIYNALMSHPAKVEVHVDGIAASIGSVIAQAGDRVVMAHGSEMMIHKAWGVCIDNADGMVEFAGLLTKLDRNIADVYADRSGEGDTDGWLGLMAAETWYSAKEAVAAGLADEYRKVPKRGEDEPEDRTAAWDLSMFHFAGRSKAPEPPKAERSRPEARVCPNHQTAAEQGTWDANAERGKLDWPVSRSVANRFAAYIDDESLDDENEVTRAAAMLPHHFVDDDGNPGAASIAGINAAKARLSGSNIPEQYHAAILAHLNNHLPDDDEEDKAGPAPEGLNVPRMRFDLKRHLAAV